MRVWIVSRECAGLAEAGGVKNVARSLCASLAGLGHKVRLFIPLYGCTDLSGVKAYRKDCASSCEVFACGRTETVGFDSGILDGIKVVFVRHGAFLEKQGVYTYTAAEQEENPARRKGMGHEDSQFLNVLFQKAVVAYGARRWKAPDIIHCQDAAAALIPAFMRQNNSIQSKINGLAKTRCLVTIHNAGPGYHHSFSSLEEAAFCTGLPESILAEGMSGGRVEPYLLSASSGAELSTVSPRYAEELLSRENSAATDGLSEEFVRRNVRISGITNGIDFSSYDPADSSKSLLPFEYDPLSKNFSGKYLLREYFESMQAHNGGPLFPEQGVALEGTGLVQYGYLAQTPGQAYFAYHGRMVHQKGVDVLCQAAEILLSRCEEARFVIVGQGSPELERMAAELSLRHAGRCVYFCGYDRAFCRLCTAACDFMVLPSNFEPCGLEDMISACLGTIPVAHATGGLAKIVHGQTGFLYEPNTPEALSDLLLTLARTKIESPKAFNNMVQVAADYMRTEFSWEKITRTKYLPLYRKILKRGGRFQPGREK